MSVNLQELQSEISKQEEILKTSPNLNSQKKAEKRLSELRAVESTATKVVVDSSWNATAEEGEKVVEVQKRNGAVYGGGMALGLVVGALGGPVGMAIGYGIAKAAEISSRPQYAVVDKDEQELKDEEIARLEAQLANLKNS